MKILGRTLGHVFRDSKVLGNPIAKIVIGCVTTAVVQSSGVTVSMIVTIVHAKILTVAEAIYFVLGANIGTTVTSLIVAFLQAGDRDQFRRAFAAATLSDTYNWLGVLIMMPLEIVTHQIFGKGIAFA